jgi:ornithine carbamoyltransferase
MESVHQAQREPLSRDAVRALHLTGRDFLKESDFTPLELTALLHLASQLKRARADKVEPQLLSGKNLAAIFEKTSTRTRIAFNVAMTEQGGSTTFLDASSSQIGHKESPADTARVLERLFDAIEYRGSEQSVVEELAHYSRVPVYNGLTNQWHPTQMLADFLTMQEHAHNPDQLSYCFVGDARFNMANSLLTMGALMGADVRLVAPESLWPAPDIVASAKTIAQSTGANILLTTDIEQGVTGVEFVHTDVWVSMGEPENEWAQRIDLLRDYQVNNQLMAYAGNNAKFMHCLPAYHDSATSVGARIAREFDMPDGVEVTHEVFESRANIAFDQAENRMHTIKAILVATLA